MADTDWYATYAKREDELRPIVQHAIEAALRAEAGQQPAIRARLIHGAIGLDPKHLVIWYLFKTDREKKLSDASGQMKRLTDHTLKALDDFKYPHHTVGPEHVCFASEEEIESAGGHTEFFQ